MVVALVVAFALAATVIAVVIQRSREVDSRATGPSAPTTVPTVTEASTAKPTAALTTTSPPPTTLATTTTIEPTTTTRPLPTGVACPNTAPLAGTVVIRDTGDRLQFRTTPARTATNSVDSAGQGATIFYWADAGNLVFDDTSHLTWLKAQLPTNPASCGFVAATSVNVQEGLFPDLGDPSDDCDTYETTWAAVELCPFPQGSSFEVTWKARPASARLIGFALPNGMGWYAQTPGSVDEYRIDRDAFTILRAGTEIYREPVRVVH